MLRQAIWKMRLSTVEICMIVPLSYSLVNGMEIVFEKVSLIDMPNLGSAS